MATDPQHFIPGNEHEGRFEHRHALMDPLTQHDRPAVWLGGLRIYLVVLAAGNLIWETLHLPLYTIWTTGTWSEQAFAAVHCTLGDLLIGLSSLIVALILVGDPDWPRRRFWQVAGLTMIGGLAYTVFSEWMNVVVRASWAYSERMPVISLLGVQIGLSPLLQWIVVPAAAFKFTRGSPKAKVGHQLGHE